MYLDKINIPGHIVYVYHYIKKQILASKGFNSYLNLPGQISTYFDIYKYVHPQDIRDTLLFSKISMIIADEIPFSQLKQAVLYMDYRIKKGSGTYVRILRQSSVLEANKKIGMVCSISICNDISHIKMEGPVQFRWEGPGKTLFENMVKKERKNTNKLIPIHNLPVSARENELIFLMGKGLSSKEIADKLFISVHTVNTHRRNILKKFQVKSTTEVLMKVYG